MQTSRWPVMPRLCGFFTRSAVIDGKDIKTRGAEDIARWDLCSRDRARRDVVERLSVPW